MTNENRSRVSGIVETLRELLQETEQKFENGSDNRHHVVMESSRLSDETFEETLTTPYGSLPCFTQHFPFGPFPSMIPEALAEMWDLPALIPQKTLALDIETAATVGGKRSLPFVIGLAHAEAGSWSLEQFFLRGPEDEMALLWQLESRLNDAELLLTYNGSRFDIPLLKNRYKIVGFSDPFLSQKTIDLEPFSRNVFGRKGFATKLSSLEENILSTIRPSWVGHPVWRDVEGLGWRRGRRLAKIFAKNAQDALSLFLLLKLISDLVDNPGEFVDRLGLVIGRALAGKNDQLSLKWFLSSASSRPTTRAGFQSALKAWTNADRETKEQLLIPVMANAAETGMDGAWLAAERLGLDEMRKGNTKQAVLWTRLATKLNPPFRSLQRIERRLTRLVHKLSSASGSRPRNHVAL